MTMAVDETSGRRIPNFRRHPERRELMIDAALEVFFAKGYEAARIEDVARLSGVGKSAVLYHFGSKLSLVTSVVTKHCLPMEPLSGGPRERIVAAGLADPAATKVLRLVMAEQRRLPRLGRLYLAAVLRRVTNWGVFDSVESVRNGVSSAFGQIAERVLLEGFPTPADSEDGQHA